MSKKNKADKHYGLQHAGYTCLETVHTDSWNSRDIRLVYSASSSLSLFLWDHILSQWSCKPNLQPSWILRLLRRRHHESSWLQENWCSWKMLWIWLTTTTVNSGWRPVPGVTGSRGPVEFCRRRPFFYTCKLIQSLTDNYVGGRLSTLSDSDICVWRTSDFAPIILKSL